MRDVQPGVRPEGRGPDGRGAGGQQREQPQVTEYRRLEAFYAERLAAQDADVPGYAAAFAEFSSLVCSPQQLVVPPLSPDPLVAVLPQRGRHLHGPASPGPGEPSQCHANACVLWLAGEVDSVVTGYALSGDGLWRQHSAGWVVEQGGSTVVETTEARVAYFVGRLSSLGTWALAASVLDPSVAFAAAVPSRHADLDRLVAALGASGSPEAALVALGDDAWSPW